MNSSKSAGFVLSTSLPQDTVTYRYHLYNALNSFLFTLFNLKTGGGTPYRGKFMKCPVTNFTLNYIRSGQVATLNLITPYISTLDASQSPRPFGPRTPLPISYFYLWTSAWEIRSVQFMDYPLKFYRIKHHYFMFCFLPFNTIFVIFLHYLRNNITLYYSNFQKNLV